MAHFTTTVTSPAATDEAYRYLADFASVAQWDPTVVEASLISGEPGELNARYRVAIGWSVLQMTLEYQIVEADPPKAPDRPARVALRAENRDVVSYDVITFIRAQTGHRHHLRRGTVGQGVRRVFDLGFGLAMQVIGRRARGGLAAAVAALPAAEQQSCDVAALQPPKPTPGPPARRRLEHARRGAGDECGRKLHPPRHRHAPSAASLDPDRQRPHRTGGADHRRVVGARSSRRATTGAAGASLVLVGRDEQRLAAAAQACRAAGSPDVRTIRADLTLLAEAEGLVDQVLADYERLDVLIHNAGALVHDYRRTEEGFEETYAAQVLSQHVLTTGLLPLLTATPGSRVIVVSSGGMYTEKLEADRVEFDEEHYDGVVAYARPSARR